MPFFLLFKPKNLKQFFRSLDSECYVPNKDSWDAKPAIILITAGFSLLFVNYLKNSDVFFSALHFWLELTESNPRQAFNTLRQLAFFNLLPHIWWSFCHVLAWVVIPILLIKVIFKDQLANYGIGPGLMKKHVGWYCLICLPIPLIVIFASSRGDFLSYYPFYQLASRSWVDLILWEIVYLLQFLCVEFFFRGFLLHSLKPRFGSSAIFIMCVPYLMIHFTKPWPEATGAILFGIFLGILAIRSKSIWGGVMIHVMLALSMDLAVLITTNRLPSIWWPI